MPAGLTEGSRLPWSPLRPNGVPAPHWLLVTGRRADSWHVVDAFAGLLASGEQRPYVGWLSTAQLTGAMMPVGWSAEQQMRNSLAFGFPVRFAIKICKIYRCRREAGIYRKRCSELGLSAVHFTFPCEQ